MLVYKELIMALFGSNFLTSLDKTSISIMEIEGDNLTIFCG
jgi:hypothetical protein